MYREPPALPALERRPEQMLAELGVLEPGEQSEIEQVERVRTTVARVRVAYDIAGEPVGEQDEIVVDVPGAPEGVARQLGRSQCVVEREVSEHELDALPRRIRRALRSVRRNWRELGGGKAAPGSARVRVEDVLRVDLHGRTGKRRAWIGTSPLRLLGVQQALANEDLIPRKSPFAGLPMALVYLGLAALELGLILLIVYAVTLTH